MSKATHHELGWEVLAQPTGEVLTAEARSPGLLLGLLGVPKGFETRDAEGWLYDVAGVTHESSASRPATRPIPAILDHALTGLLFSHAELWDQPGVISPCSFAFIEGRGEVGFGWVGDAKISVWVDGEPRETGFVTLRDARGRLGRGWSIPSYHNVQVRISWRSSGTDPTSGGAEVEASWIADGRSAPGYHAVPVHNEQAAVFESHFPALAAAPAGEGSLEGAREPLPEPIPLITEVAPAPVVASKPARQRRGLVAWFKGLFGLGEEEGELDEDEVWRVAAEETVDVVATGTDDAIGYPVPTAPQYGPPGPTLQLAERAPTGIQHDRPVFEESSLGLEHQVSGFEGSSREFDHEIIEIDLSDAPEATSPAPATSGEEHVFQVPPTPEAAELTERAFEWGAAEDPHGIELSAHGPSARLSRIEESLREVDRGLELVGITPDEPAVSAALPPSARIAESFGSEPVVIERVRPEPPAEQAPAPRAAEAESTHAPLQSEAGEAPESLPSAWTTIAPQHPAWPTPQELERTRRPSLVRHLWPWALLVAALFAGGWLVGGMQDDGRPRDASHPGRLASALRALGLGGPRYLLQVNSRPPGAWISVDGEPLSLRTPAAVEASPGQHVVSLSFSEYGNASFKVDGRKGDHVPLDAALWGALEVVSPDGIGVIGVAVDGLPRGFAPLRVDSLSPGVHEVRFSGPGMEPWGQTVEIKVRETHELLSRAVQSPTTGVLEVQASFTDETGSQPLKGAPVWVDGEPRGITPLVLDLPRGPHSVRLVYKGQDAPIQVIDLPGGNQRFAVFEIGNDSDAPRLTVDVAARIPRDRPAVMSATVIGISPSDLREMWLHVQMPEGAWRRYAMTLLKASAGAAGVVTFPTAAFDAQGHTRYYVSAQSGQGDETFTELKSISLEGPPAGH